MSLKLFTEVLDYNYNYASVSHKLGWAIWILLLLLWSTHIIMEKYNLKSIIWNIFSWKRTNGGNGMERKLGFVLRTWRIKFLSCLKARKRYTINLHQQKRKPIYTELAIQKNHAWVRAQEQSEGRALIKKSYGEAKIYLAFFQALGQALPSTSSESH